MVPIVDIRSSWIIEDGWARPLGTPKQHGEPYVALPIHVRVRHLANTADRGLEIAKAEIARRIRTKVGR
mgnify:CR=1 FL=1